MTTDRLEAFSDGCIAIFITITLLTFQLPEGDTYANLWVQAPAFFCYAISFIVIGIYWGNHHHLIHTIEKVSEKNHVGKYGMAFCAESGELCDGLGGTLYACPTYSIIFWCHFAGMQSDLCVS